MAEVKSRFAATIDRPMLALAWEIDEFAMFLIPAFFSLMLKQLIFGFIIGIVLMKAYGKFKASKPNNYIFHLFWKMGVANIKDTPPAFIRKFRE